MISALKRGFQRLATRASRDALADVSRFSAETKAAQVLLFNELRQIAMHGSATTLEDVGFRVFSQCDEDGILLAIFAAAGTTNKTFLDIGAADGINSNCANLAMNWGWWGLFVDGDARGIERGREYYGRQPDTRLFPPQFIQAHVTRANVNQVLADAGLRGEIDLLSIDIDGNDYWLWEALEGVNARVVVIETHVEFGMRNIVVPYDEAYVYPGKHPDYFGASPVAMAKLAARKGYRLVGANRYGFNTFYVKRGIAESILPEVPVESVLRHPRNKERGKLFEAVKGYEYAEG